MGILAAQSEKEASKIKEKVYRQELLRQKLEQEQEAKLKEKKKNEWKIISNHLEEEKAKRKEKKEKIKVLKEESMQDKQKIIENKKLLEKEEIQRENQIIEKEQQELKLKNQQDIQNKINQMNILRASYAEQEKYRKEKISKDQKNKKEIKCQGLDFTADRNRVFSLKSTNI